MHGSDDKKRHYKKKTETRYYKADEWHRPSSEEKKTVMEQRSNCGGGDRDGPAKKPKYEDRISALETKLLEAQQQISAARTEAPLLPAPPVRGPPLNPPA